MRYWLACSCAAPLELSERTMAVVSVTFAVFGRCSLSWMPDTFVGIALNSPRNSDGASGFGSKESRWLGPPEHHSRITASAFDADAAEAARIWRNCGRDSPKKESAP